MKQLLLSTKKNVLGEVAWSRQMKQLHEGKFLCAVCGSVLGILQLEFLPPASFHDQSSIFCSNCYLVVQHETANCFLQLPFPEDWCEVKKVLVIFVSIGWQPHFQLSRLKKALSNCWRVNAGRVPSIYQLFALLRCANCGSVARMMWRFPCFNIHLQENIWV